MADQTEADKLMQQLIAANKTMGLDNMRYGREYSTFPERMYSSSDAMTRNFSYTANQPPQFSGYIVLNAHAIALDAPDKLVKRAIELPFVPVAGMVLRVTDGYALPIRDDATKHDVVFTFRVLESLWDEQQEQFQARCEKIDGQGYERLADAVHWESYK